MIEFQSGKCGNVVPEHLKTLVVQFEHQVDVVSICIFFLELYPPVSVNVGVVFAKHTDDIPRSLTRARYPKNN